MIDHDINVLFFVVETRRHLGYERVYLEPREVADTPFHIQGDDVLLLNMLKMQFFLYRSNECLTRLGGQP